jgi:Amt family ammonium transporter
MKQLSLIRRSRCLPGWISSFVFVCLLLLAPSVFAAAPVVQVVDKGDVAWMLTSTLLVLLMTVPGLALFYGGLVRSKNVLSVLMQVMTVFSMMPSSVASASCF